jgi:tRNA A-37 threonylcarbamoyl transferase component Bud32
MSTIPVRWSEVRAAFAACAELPAEQRADALAERALPAHEQAEVMSLLAHHDAGTSVLDTPAAHRFAGPAARVGERLGAWQIVQPIGSGGMGDVYEVRRADGRFEQRAAAKLLKRGMDSQAVLRRFALERQALAQLAHPHIARLLDAGANAEGLPFFVMEHVDGDPIDAAALARPLPERLALFLQLADAVAHAHRNLLVHRDLKPGNVLVDRSGQVKLLDFGIAKALQPGADEAVTAVGVRAFTPEHAAPEQVNGEAVSTATDVHGLGRLLARMLTGEKWQPAATGSTAPWRALGRDLDAILRKALADEPAERYASADAMAADVRAVLEGRPVSVRVPHPAYVLGKFLRRNPASTAAGLLGAIGTVFGLAAALGQQQLLGALGVAGLAVGLGVALREARRSARARQLAEGRAADLRALSRDIVVGFGDVVRHLPGGREQQAWLLDTSVGHLERLLQASGGDDLAVMAELAVAHAQLVQLRAEHEFNARTDAQAVQQHASRAVALAERAAAVGDATLHVAWASALHNLARLAQGRSDLAAAHDTLDRSDSVVSRALQRWPGHVALRRQRAANTLTRGSLRFGWDRPNAGDPQGALDAYREAAGQFRALAADSGLAHDVFEIGTATNACGLVFIRQERWHDALAAARAGLAERERALALEPHNRTLRGGVMADRNLVAGLSLDVGDAPGALAASEPAWAGLAAMTAEDPDNASWQTQRRWLAFHHGRALLGCGRAAEAVAVLAVSADWLQGLVDAGEASPRQALRLARTRLAQARAEAALGGDGSPWVRRAEATLLALTPPDRDSADGRRAREELAAWQAQVAR